MKHLLLSCLDSAVGGPEVPKVTSRRQDYSKRNIYFLVAVNIKVDLLNLKLLDDFNCSLAIAALNIPHLYSALFRQLFVKRVFASILPPIINMQADRLYMAPAAATAHCLCTLTGTHFSTLSRKIRRYGRDLNQGSFDPKAHVLPLDHFCFFN